MDVSVEQYNTSLQELTVSNNKRQKALENGKIVDSKYNDLMVEARSENKYLFIFFYLEGCSGCTVLRYLIQNNPQIIENLQKHKVLMVNMTETITSMSNKLNIYSYPSYFILDPDGNVIKKNTGCDVNNGAENNFLDWLNN